MEDRSIDQYASLLPLEVCTELQTAPQGLSDEEAQARLARYGPNKISDNERPMWLSRIFAPFLNWITLLLLLAGALAFVSGPGSYLIGWAIIVVAVLNGLFTAWQEYLAEREIAALQHLLPETTFVRRDGQISQQPTESIVPGDVLPLRPNVIVVADGYLIAGEGLRVKQTMLTGNSAPITKMIGPLPDHTLPLAERPNLVLAGTQVIEGQGSIVATSTGMRTLLGEIAQSTAALRAERSPLGRALNRLAGTVSRVAIAAGFGAFALVTLSHNLDTGQGVIFAIGMIVAFVPEGLLPTVTLALALARRRLQRHGVLVKQLAGVESLSSATTLCIDKTDNLSAGAVTVSAIWAGGQDYRVSGSGYTPEGAFLRERVHIAPCDEPDLPALLRAAALCNNARLISPDASHADWHILGDMIEGALLTAAAKAELDPAELAAATTRLQGFPYDPRRQMTSVIVATAGESGRDPTAYVRGSGAAVLPLCTSIRERGEVLPLDNARRAAVSEQIDRYAREGMRVLALAERRLDSTDACCGWRAQNVEHDLTLLGLAGLHDPPSPEFAQLIEGCRRAGLRVILTTGAYSLTAEASARRAGIVDAPHTRIVPGAELDEFDAAALELALGQDNVIFVQLGAEQKRRIVGALQARGEVVAFLGDSINDAPALKQADIGVAVSASGTTVALAAADIVLDAAHPAGLLLALEEGRAIFSNIQKFSSYIFTHNVAESIVVGVSILLGFPLPLTVLQVLAIDLGAELFPAIALSAEPPKPTILDQPPRPRSAPLLDQAVLLRAFAWLGLLESALALFAYLMGYWDSGWRPGLPIGDFSGSYAQATTLAYAAIVLSQVGNALTSRSRRISLRQIGLFTNPALLAGVLISVGLMLALLYVPPLAAVFGFVPPHPTQWLVLLTFPLIMIAAEEGRKYLVAQRYRGRTLRRQVVSTRS